MTAKEICLENKTVVYFSGWGGIEVKKIEYGIENCIYCVSGTWTSKKSYHKFKIFSSSKGEYINYHGNRCYLHDFLRS